MKKLEITISDKTFEQLEMVLKNSQELLVSDTVKHPPVTIDEVITRAIHSEYLRKFHPNPMNIVLIQHTYVQLLDLIKEEKEMYKHIPIADFSDVEVTPLKIISKLIEKDYNRLHNIHTSIIIDDEDLLI